MQFFCFFKQAKKQDKRNLLHSKIITKEEDLDLDI